VVDYGKRPAGTATVSLDDVDNDGAVDEHDNVHADIESATGAGTGGSEDPITFTVDPVTVPEGGPGARTAATFTVRLGAPAPRPTTLDWTVAGTTATAGSDFAAGAGQVTVAQGETTATFVVTVLGDAIDEPDETAQVTLTRGGGSTPASATLTITDDDVLPVTASVASVRVVEGAAGSRTPAMFTVRLAAPATQPVTLGWSVSGGTATVGTDVAAGQGQVTVPEGQSTGSFTVTVLGDGTVEPDETAVVTVTGGSAPATATLTIVNDDKPAPPPVVVPTVTIRSASLKEPDRGTRPMTFTIVLSQATTRPVAVRFATASGTAKAGKDFVATSGTITFAAGQTTKTVTVQIKGDRVKERNEKFQLRITGVTNGRVGTSGTGTIRNDD
jgi:chitinase